MALPQGPEHHLRLGQPQVLHSERVRPVTSFTTQTGHILYTFGAAAAGRLVLMKRASSGARPHSGAGAGARVASLRGPILPSRSSIIGAKHSGAKALNPGGVGAEPPPGLVAGRPRAGAAAAADWE